MIIKNWNRLPDNMKNEKVRPYYNYLRKRSFSLILKRIFDMVASIVLVILLLPIFVIVAIIIKVEDGGSIFYRQIRITQYGKDFRIFKFRTMIPNADKVGTLVTAAGDSRITKCGTWIRRFRIDEIPQLFNIIKGEMTFVGTRPEVRKYVDSYSDEMLATLLLPAGVTSEASIKYKDEDEILGSAEDADKAYINDVLPEKMKYNLESLSNFSFLYEIKIMLDTVIAVIK